MQGSNARIVDARLNMVWYSDRSGEEHFLFLTSSDKSSATGLQIASSKSRSAVLINDLGIPTPTYTVCRTFAEMLGFLVSHKRIVVKPNKGSGGRGVSTNVTTPADLKQAYTFAKKHDTRVIAQQHVEGDDLRLLVIAGTFVSAVRRNPAHVTGDGKSTIRTLIARENQSFERNNPENISLLPIDTAAAERYLGKDIDTVPVSGTNARVAGPANVSLGGTFDEATHLVTREMIADAERLSRTLKLGICGVDLLWDRTNNNYVVIEINANPGIDIHDDTFSGTHSDAAKKYVRWLIDPHAGMTSMEQLRK